MSAVDAETSVSGDGEIGVTDVLDDRDAIAGEIHPCAVAALAFQRRAAERFGRVGKHERDDDDVAFKDEGYEAMKATYFAEMETARQGEG